MASLESRISVFGHGMQHHRCRVFYSRPHTLWKYARYETGTQTHDPQIKGNGGSRLFGTQLADFDSSFGISIAAEELIIIVVNLLRFMLPILSGLFEKNGMPRLVGEGIHATVFLQRTHNQGENCPLRLIQLVGVAFLSCSNLDELSYTHCSSINISPITKTQSSAAS
jgi:hypothetical protein